MTSKYISFREPLVVQNNYIEYIKKYIFLLPR